MTWPLLLAALCVWALGAAIDLTVGADRYAGRMVPYAAATAGAALACAAGVLSVLGHPRIVDLGSTLGVGRTVLRIDGLAGLFLTLTSAMGVLLSACLLGWVGRRGWVRGHGTAAGYLLLLGSVTVVLMAGDAFTFLFAWESLTIAFYILVGIGSRSRPRSISAWVTFGLGKIGGAALLVGFLLLAGRSGSYQLASWSHVPAGALRDTAYTLIVVGFGAKVGLVPLHGWIPSGYPAAPGPTRAALAGIAANVGFYGLWRFLGVLGKPPLWLPVAVLLIAGLTALGGITFAAVQSNINRVVAYSSIENAGLIVVGYGVALAGAAASRPRLVAIGLLAGSLQILAHAVAKTALFASSAFFTADLGTEAVDELQGVARTHRWSAATFAVGSLTLSALPPTIGFVSEWFLLESLMQEFRVGSLALRLSMLAAGAMVAMTAGVAALTFIRLVGLTILGRSERPAPEEATDGSAAGRAAMGILALSCVGLAAAAPWVIRYTARGLATVVPAAAVTRSLKSPWVLQPVYANFSILSPSWLAVVMPVGFLSVTALALALSRGRMLRVRRVPAWRSATAGVSGGDHYSSFGYANVLRHVLGNILGTSSQKVDTSRVHDLEPAEAAHLEVRTVVVEPVETYLYRPARAWLLALSRLAKRLQSGRLDAYMTYMLIALLVVLVVVASVQ